MTVQRETILRSELLAMLPAIAKARHDIFRRRAQLRTLLEQLASDDLQRRIPRQEVCMRFSHVTQRDMAVLTKRLHVLESRRKTTMAKFMEIRAAREKLERLREKSHQKHVRAQLRLEQKAMDESSHGSYARKRADVRLSGANRSKQCWPE